MCKKGCWAYEDFLLRSYWLILWISGTAWVERFTSEDWSEDWIIWEFQATVQSQRRACWQGRHRYNVVLISIRTYFQQHPVIMSHGRPGFWVRKAAQQSQMQKICDHHPLFRFTLNDWYRMSMSLRSLWECDDEDDDAMLELTFREGVSDDELEAGCSNLGSATVRSSPAACAHQTVCSRTMSSGSCARTSSGRLSQITSRTKMPKLCMSDSFVALPV